LRSWPAPGTRSTRFWTAGVEAGYRSDGEPGPRPVYHEYRDNGAPGERPISHPGYYGAFVLDPDGNNIEAVHHNR
jgi:catechol 2,3-dioxygenase-like lactoylglutathione lyase family enzyme